ncbi:MAG: shikimate dehydrogenase [bacterium]
MKKFGVIGHPISHSLSPLLHGTAYSLLRMDCSYQAYDVPLENLETSLNQFRQEGFTGLNVTLPLKQAVIPRLDRIDHEAESIGAVNTLHFDGSILTGYNTDVIGVRRTLQPFELEIAGRNVVILGAGGSARSMIFALKNIPISRLTIISRTASKLEELYFHAKQLCPDVEICSSTFNSESLSSTIEEAGLVMNATPVGMFPNITGSPITNPSVFHAEQIIVDMIYIPLETALLRLAKSKGARTLSGLEVFLHQGASAFELWNGISMPVEEIRPVILNALAKQMKEAEKRI